MDVDLVLCTSPVDLDSKSLTLDVGQTSCPPDFIVRHQGSEADCVRRVGNPQERRRLVRQLREKSKVWYANEK